MNKKFFCSLLVTGLVVLGMLIVGCAKKEEKGAATVEGSQKVEEVRPIRNAIEIKAEGEVLHYRKKSLWNEKDFSEIMGSRNKFESREIDSFKRTLKKYNRYAITPRIEFDESEKSTLLICDIKDAKEGFWFDFDWFLRPHGLDFIDSHFERKEKELYWEGEINGVKTAISIKFPYSVSNCHEHVWPAR